jgi:hypothetical protein
MCLEVVGYEIPHELLVAYRQKHKLMKSTLRSVALLNPQRLCSHLDDHSLTYSVRTWTNEILTSLAVAQKHRVNGHPMIAQLIASDYP